MSRRQREADAAKLEEESNVLARAQKTKASGGMSGALYEDYGVDGDVAYLHRLTARQQQLAAFEHEHGSTNRWWEKVGSKDDGALQDLSRHGPADYRQKLEAERADATAMLGYKLDQIDRVSKFWDELPDEDQALSEKKIRDALADYTPLTKQDKQGQSRKVMRAKLEVAGVLLLPEGMPMGGVFPARDACVIEGAASEGERFDTLVRHANALIRKYQFLDAGEGRLLNKKSDGCVCIMFAEEPGPDGKSVYVPFFGVSGGVGGAFPPETYTRKLGTPGIKPDVPAAANAARQNPNLAGAPPGTVQHCELSEERAEKMGKAGERLWGRFFELYRFYDERRALGLKLPARQAMLSYMQYLAGEPSGLENSIKPIEKWNSIQCAEPVAVMAAAQLHYRMADMDLSVPFEGTKLIKPDDTTGHYGKETCGRCAVSEMSFAGVLASGERKEVRMKSVTMTQAAFDQALNDELVWNKDPTKAAYPDPKRQNMFTAMSFLHATGIAQSDQSGKGFWTGDAKQPRPLPGASPDPIEERAAETGLSKILGST